MKTLSRSRSGQMLLMDALVFFLVLSISAALPSLFLSRTNSVLDTALFSSTRNVADDGLVVVLQSTIPLAPVPLNGTTGVVANVAVTDGILHWSRWLLDPEITFCAVEENSSALDSFVEQVSLVVSGAMPLGYSGVLIVELGSDIEYNRSFRALDARYVLIQRDVSIASAEHHFPMENVRVRLLVWLL